MRFRLQKPTPTSQNPSRIFVSCSNRLQRYKGSPNRYKCAKKRWRRNHEIDRLTSTRWRKDRSCSRLRNKGPHVVPAVVCCTTHFGRHQGPVAGLKQIARFRGRDARTVQLVVSSPQPIEQCGPHATNMHIPGRAGREPGSHNRHRSFPLSKSEPSTH